jgi:hypothetical protein
MSLTLALLTLKLAETLGELLRTPTLGLEGAELAIRGRGNLKIPDLM